MGLLGFGKDKEETEPTAPIADDVNKRPEDIQQQPSDELQNGQGETVSEQAIPERRHQNDVILEQAGERLVKKEVSLKRGDGTPVAFMYTRADGSTFEVAAESLLVGQLDEKLDKQPVVQPSEAEIAQEAAQAEEQYARPEYVVTDTSGNFLRSYNTGVHGQEAKEKAEQYAAKVNGIVKEKI